MGERLRVGLVLMGLGVPMSASAGALEDDLSGVRTQIAAGDHKDALKALKTIEKSLGEVDAVVSTRSLARVWFYKGAAEFGTGNKKGRAEDAWRQALAIQNDFPWDTDLMGDSDLISLFEALRGEVEGRGYVDTGVPEKIGAAKLYVDGVRHGSEETVIRGSHLAQIECPDAQGTFSVITDFSRPVDWFAMCPGGVDTSVEVAEAEEDEWAEFGPSFGVPTFAEDDPVAEDPVAEDPVAEEPVVEEPAEDPVAEDPAASADATADASDTTEPVVEDPAEPVVEKPPRQTGDGPGLGTYMLASGGALLAGGMVVNFAWVNPTYSEIEAANNDPYSISRSDANALTSSFNTARFLTIGLTAGGVALMGSSFLVHAPVKPVIGLNQLGVSGRF